MVLRLCTLQVGDVIVGDAWGVLFGIRWRTFLLNLIELVAPAN